MAKRKAEKEMKPWERSRHRSSGQRRVGTRPTYRSFLIVCEGTETEPNYFEQFRAVVRFAKISVRGLGKDPATIVHKAKGHCAKEEARRGSAFDEVWCVFDVDDFGEVVNAAVRAAKDAGFQVACSNPCIELWFLLHFHDQREAITRDQLFARLSSCLKREYSKTDPDLFALLYDHRAAAVQRAEKLVASYSERSGGLNLAVHNPVTKVHELVEALFVNLDE